MTAMKKSGGKRFSLVFSITLLILITAVIIPGVMGASANVNLGTAGNYVILAESGISTTGTTSIVGNVGVSPINSTAITGFGLVADPSNQFSTSSLVTGNVYAADYAVPTPATLTTAISDMQTAYTAANGQAPGVTELGAGNIGGLILAPGVYKWSTGVTIPTDVTLSGGPNDVWVFQIAQNLVTSSNTHVILTGGAQAQNVYWVVAGQTTLGTGSVFNGNVLDQTAIVMNTGATFNGRALAQSAVTLDANTVTLPALTVTPTPTPTAAAPSSGSNSGGGGGGGGSYYSSSGSGAGILPSGQLAPAQAPPASAVLSGGNNPSAAPATGQLAPPQTAPAATTTKAATPGLSFMGIAGIVALLAIFGVALLVYIRRHP
jgi:hypothetical protein